MNDYLKNFDSLVTDLGRVANKTFAKRSRKSSLVKWESELPGLTQIFESFDSKTEIGRLNGLHVEEWNPISQRLMVDSKVYSDKQLTKSFSNISNNIRRFLTSAHEATHVLGMEPFFVGSLELKSAKDFRNYYLLNEAFSFWYADILVTPKLRERLPDGEFVFSRSAMSSPFFHPYRALRAEGVKSDLEALNLYLAAFSGDKTKLLKNKNAFSQNLAQRIYQFYFDSITPTKFLFELFQKVGIFSRFQERFCKIDNLPSLLSPKILKLANLQSGGFFMALAKDGYREISRISAVELESVVIRRRLQTRAYFATCLRYVIDNKLIFSPEPVATKDFLTSVDEYLLGIEMLLKNELVQRELKTCTQKIFLLDSLFQRRVISKFKAKDMWVAERGVFLKWNAAPAKGSCFSRVSDAKDLPEHINGLLALILLEMERAPRSILELADIVSKLNAIAQKPMTAAAVEKYNRILMSDAVRELWSLPLHSISPLHNSYRDILFQYQ